MFTVMEKLGNLSKGYLISLFLLVFFDFTSKTIALNYLELLQKNDFLPFIDFLIVFNSGIAFSLLDLNNSLSRYLLLIIIFCVTLYFLKVFLDETDNLKKKSLIMIIGGALGNLFDRVPDGVVTDFLHLKIFDYSFFVFNLADTYITIGAIIFIIREIILLKSRHESKN